MKVFFIVAIMFFLMIVLMAIGVLLFRKKPIAGSCGGLNTIGIDKACDCDKPCDKRTV